MSGNRERQEQRVCGKKLNNVMDVDDWLIYGIIHLKEMIANG